MLLQRLGVPFTVRVTDVEELEQGPDPALLAVENALRKARAAQREGVREAILGCDTIVVLDGVVYGKPPDAAVARTTLSALAGRTHEVISGVALLRTGIDAAIDTDTDTPPTTAATAAAAIPGARERTTVARTAVTFRALDEDTLDAYLATEEWRGRSGGYAIQGAAAQFALSIEGEIENVVGLPIAALRELDPALFGER